MWLAVTHGIDPMFSVCTLTSHLPVLPFLWASQLISSKPERGIKVSNILSSWRNPENYQSCKGGKSYKCFCMRKGHAEPLLEQSDTRLCYRKLCPARNFCYPHDGNSWLVPIKKHSRACSSSALMLPNHCIMLYLTSSLLLPTRILWITVSLCGHCALYQRQLQN